MSLGANELAAMGNVLAAGEGAGGGGTGTGTFGSDTFVDLPNSSATNVHALELLTQLTTATAGAEVSEWIIRLLQAGAQVDALKIDPDSLGLRSGAAATPSLNFQAAPTTGWSYDNINVGWRYSVGGVAVAVFQNGSNGLWLLNALARVTFSVTTTEYIARNLSGGVTIGTGHDVQVGADGALNVAATVGFLDVPVCAGVPTGVATPRTGKASIVYDNVTNKLYGSTGGGVWNLL